MANLVVYHTVQESYFDETDQEWVDFSHEVEYARYYFTTDHDAHIAKCAVDSVTDSNYRTVIQP